MFEPGQKRENLVAFRAEENSQLVLRFTPVDKPLSVEPNAKPLASWNIGFVSELPFVSAAIRE